MLDRIKELDFEVYLPLLKVWNQWSDRKKEVEKPLIPGYIFCRIDIKDRIPILQILGVLGVLRIGGKWVPIPDDQIETLQMFLKNSETLLPEAAVQKGEQVKVFRGAFAGAIGTVLDIKGKTRLVLRLDSLQLAYSVEIDKSDLQRVE